MKSIGEIINDMLGEGTSLVPGQMAACIDDAWGPCTDGFGNVVENINPAPVKGCVYTVREVYPFMGAIFIGLVEFSPDDGFRARRFRPVRPTSIEVFRDLLAPTDGAGTLQPDRVS
ncbi:hypothetical protein J2X65_001674 [Ancylobacter sp. 3268]|uniref:hypothetical protein n=1 Tax=Ancylobacter sp. 3268 TaxID=2817752 RepID=UPI002855296D|nr:hypothetical protein [Ancylobacter sp. 3268]MDR6952319.1 hypothetical protein [Ancylobacter sp. 3268]